VSAPAPNDRFHGVVAELAQVINEEHSWDCLHENRKTFCGHDRARAVLAYLHGAGLIWWGSGINPIPPLPDSAEDPYALRLMGEFWHPVSEQKPEEAEAGIRRYHWLPGVLAVHGGYPGKGETAVRTFLDDLTKEQVGHLVPVLRAVLAKLDPEVDRSVSLEQLAEGLDVPPVAELPEGGGHYSKWMSSRGMSLRELRELCDGVRARLMYDRSRSISTYDAYVWTCLGWDVGHHDGTGLLHPSQAVSKIFYAPAWRPTLEELAWFRDGFARQREGSPRPMMRG
jgi:hypothetical protein